MTTSPGSRASTLSSLAACFRSPTTTDWAASVMRAAWFQLHRNRRTRRHRPQPGRQPFASFFSVTPTPARSTRSGFIGQQFLLRRAFVQDDWRVSRNLMLNLGLRWDTDLPPTGFEDRWSDFSPTTPNPGAGGRPGAVLFAGTGTGAWARARSPTLVWRFGSALRLCLLVEWQDRNSRMAMAALSADCGRYGIHPQHGLYSDSNFPNQSGGIRPTFSVGPGVPRLDRSAVHQSVGLERYQCLLVAGQGNRPAAGSQ